MGGASFTQPHPYVVVGGREGMVLGGGRGADCTDRDRLVLFCSSVFRANGKVSTRALNPLAVDSGWSTLSRWPSNLQIHGRGRRTVLYCL